MFDAMPYKQEEGKEGKVRWAIFLKGLMGCNARLHYRKILLFRVQTVCRGSTHGIDTYTVSHTL
jgi:hypothetical protein